MMDLAVVSTSDVHALQSFPQYNLMYRCVLWLQCTSFHITELNLIRKKIHSLLSLKLYRAYTIGSIGVASDPSLPKDPVPPVVALLVKLLGLGQISIWTLWLGFELKVCSNLGYYTPFWFYDSSYLNWWVAHNWRFCGNYFFPIFKIS